MLDAESVSGTLLPAYELLGQGATWVLVLFAAIPADRIVTGKRKVDVCGVSMFPEKTTLRLRYPEGAHCLG